MIQGIIYKWTNLKNNKSYIGKTTREKDRYYEHLKDRRKEIPFHRALDKYGVNNFKYEVILKTSSNSIHNLNVILNTLEKHYIKKFKSNDKNFGYNLTEGGDGVKGYKLTDEQRKVISDRMKISNPMKGYKYTDEQKKEISARRKGHKPYNNREVIQLSLNGDYINTWESALKAAVTLSTYNNRTNITKACRTGRTALGYKWKYKE